MSLTRSTQTLEQMAPEKDLEDEKTTAESKEEQKTERQPFSMYVHSQRMGAKLTIQRVSSPAHRDRRDIISPHGRRARPLVGIISCGRQNRQRPWNCHVEPERWGLLDPDEGSNIAGIPRLMHAVFCQLGRSRSDGREDHQGWSDTAEVESGRTSNCGSYADQAWAFWSHCNATAGIHAETSGCACQKLNGCPLAALTICHILHLRGSRIGETLGELTF